MIQVQYYVCLTCRTQERLEELLALVLGPLSSNAGCYQNEQKLSKVHFGILDSLHMLIVAQKSVSRGKQRKVRTWLSIVMRFHDTATKSLLCSGHFSRFGRSGH